MRGRRPDPSKGKVLAYLHEWIVLKYRGRETFTLLGSKAQACLQQNQSSHKIFNIGMTRDLMESRDWKSGVLPCRRRQPKAGASDWAEQPHRGCNPKWETCFSLIHNCARASFLGASVWLRSSTVYHEHLTLTKKSNLNICFSNALNWRSPKFGWNN